MNETRTQFEYYKATYWLLGPHRKILPQGYVEAITNDTQVLKV